MFKYRSQNLNLRLVIFILLAVIAVQVVYIVMQNSVLARALETRRVHIPPDLSNGATVALDEVPKPNVYAFAYRIFQQLNYWPDNGEEDYGKEIYALQNMLTPTFLDRLKADLHARGQGGELRSRIRFVQEMFGHGYSEDRVKVIAPGVWVVTLDLSVVEYVKGMKVKDLVARYPIRVVRHDVSIEQNPWGLALDGFAKPGPSRLETEERKPL